MGRDYPQSMGIIPEARLREWTRVANGIHQMTDKQWDTIIALHNTAPFKLVRAAAPYFRVRDGEPRNIINISSTSGVHGKA